MTKEENIATLNEHLEHWKRLLSEKICDQSEGEKTIDALQNAIKALEQEPCADCISREKVSELLNEGWWKGIYPREAIMALPSATPMPKIGRWIYNKEEDSYRCSLCNFPCHKDNMGAIPTKYCAECAAYMQEVEDES